MQTCCYRAINTYLVYLTYLQLWNDNKTQLHSSVNVSRVAKRWKTSPRCKKRLEMWTFRGDCWEHRYSSPGRTSRTQEIHHNVSQERSDSCFKVQHTLKFLCHYLNYAARGRTQLYNYTPVALQQ